MTFMSFLRRWFNTLPSNSFPDKNTGVIREQRETDYLSGTLPYEVRNATGDWRSYLPVTERQSNLSTETMACVSYSHTSSLEIQAKKMTGKEYNWSDRFLARMSETTRNGNSLARVADSVRAFGLVNQETWPEPANYTWDSFYSNIPQDVILKGKEEFPFSIAYEWVGTTPTSLQYHLKHAPLQITIPGSNPTHAVVLVALLNGVYYYYDTYPPFLKTMTTRPADALKVVLGDKSKIKIRKIGWGFGDPERGIYFPFDTLVRQQDVLSKLSAIFPDYELDPHKEWMLGSRPWK